MTNTANTTKIATTGRQARGSSRRSARLVRISAPHTSSASFAISLGCSCNGPSTIQRCEPDTSFPATSTKESTSNANTSTYGANRRHFR